ncbi:MAG: helix-turn-helix transcriptional regulator [Anaerolineaceae bacterium]|nr:helix-turn-helix transcriptional regulator [Anaerolineaceae bacterium]
MNIKGTLPLLIMQCVSYEAKHGYQIAQQIKQKSEGVLDFKEGTLYPTLHKLQANGYLKSFSEEIKGRTRHYYQLTSNGAKFLEEERKEWNQVVKAVSLALEQSI